MRTTDGLPMLRNLQLPYLAAQGYLNLRCVWTLGCPAEIRPKTSAPPPGAAVADRDREKTELAYGAAFRELFPGAPLPEIVAASCCAQFALTARKVRERPRADYVRYRRWLLATELPDNVSGRILEYMWHSEWDPRACSELF